MIEDRLEWELELLTPLGDGVPRWVKEAATWSSPKAHKMRLSKEIQISHKSLSKWVEFLYINYPILNLQEPNLSIYNRRGLKWNTNETQSSLQIQMQIGAT